MVEVKRFELWTFRTSSERSNQLSYTSVPRDEPQPTALTMVIVSCFFSKSNTFFQKKEKYFCSFCKKRTEDYKQPKNSLRNCTKKGTTLRCVLKDSRRGNGVIRKGYTVFPCFKPHLQGFCSFHSLLQSVPFHRELLLSRPHGSELQSEHAFFRLYLSRC